jgi:hypothetical protein
MQTLLKNQRNDLAETILPAVSRLTTLSLVQNAAKAKLLAEQSSAPEDNA